MTVLAEYIWIDGTDPTPLLRSKTKVLNEVKFDGTINSLPQWSFDGSSTQQADGHLSDCILNPVHMIVDPARKNAYLVMCEVMNADGTPHSSNTRSTISEDPDFWFGFEQEYVISFNDCPLGFPENGYPSPQGTYYCAVGSNNVAGVK